MVKHLRKKICDSHLEHEFDCVALLLQGGGALGSFQFGVYEALAEANLHPNWVAGISIGAINSALIAGNAPENRVSALRKFWEHITDPTVHSMFSHLKGDEFRSFINQMSAFSTMMTGSNGFFRPRATNPWLHPSGLQESTSYYDTKDLKSTLERLVDFDRINSGEMKFAVGAVNVRTGNFIYFNNSSHHIRPEHIMASGALPPGFPAVEINGEYFYDGGLVNNTPLQHLIENDEQKNTLAFQVDLWPARGNLPRTMAEVATRQKEIQFSSRTRAASDHFKRNQKLRNALASFVDKLPNDYKTGEEYKILSDVLEQNKVYNLIHLIYRSEKYEGDSKDYEFSRKSMEEHWKIGYNDTVRTLKHPEIFEKPNNLEGVFTFDLDRDGRG